MINIYKANSIVIIIFLIFSSLVFGQDSGEFSSLCFDPSVNLKSVQDSLKLLLLPRDTVVARLEQNCLDIVTSPDRAKLLEKFLRKRYDLKSETGLVQNQEQTCLIGFRSTKKRKSSAETLKVGSKNLISSTQISQDESSTMDLLLGEGKTGELEAGDKKLALNCRVFGDKANLTFSFAQKNKGAVNSEVLVTKGEWINIASVIRDLNEKTKTLGFPQSELGQVNGNEETIYELQFK